MESLEGDGQQPAQDYDGESDDGDRGRHRDEEADTASIPTQRG
jgi:hypothetical protein